MIQRLTAAGKADTAGKPAKYPAGLRLTYLMRVLNSPAGCIAATVSAVFSGGSAATSRRAIHGIAPRRGPSAAM